MNVNSKLTSSCVLLLAALCGAHGGNPLKFAPKQGASYKYKIVLKVKLNGTAAAVTGFSTHKVTKVSSNGDVTVDSFESDMKINGKTVDAGSAGKPPITTDVTRPNGTVVKILGENASPEDYRSEMLETVEFPNSELSIGKSWVWNCPANPKTGVVKVKGEYKVLGSAILQGIHVWTISVKINELTGKKPASVTGTAWISRADGAIVKLDFVGKKLPFKGAAEPLDCSAQVELVKS